jgi:hypothetical protein
MARTAMGYQGDTASHYLTTFLGLDPKLATSYQPNHICALRAARRITDPVAGPLFSGEHAEDDQASGMPPVGTNPATRLCARHFLRVGRSRARAKDGVGYSTGMA